MTANKTFSDHKIQYACARLDRKDPILWESFTYRPFTDKGRITFKNELATLQWKTVLEATGSNRKAEKLQEVIDNLMETHFPEKTIRRKDTDLPWFNENARNMIKKKDAIYKSEGKSERWEKQREKVENYLENRRVSFIESQKQKILGPSASTEFFKNVKAFKNVEKPKSFDVRDLRPGVPDSDVAEEVACYFNRISGEFSPLEPSQIPMTFHREVPIMTEADVSKALTSAKKTRSRVTGDIFPCLINESAEFLAKPLCDIYNTILQTYVWPALWKKEYVTTIPKKNIPESLADLRNISRTLFFSKVFEGVELKRLKEEISLKPNQFGGVKGCSTTHMIVELLQEICTNAEDYRSATVIMAIDYAKAFNRVSYQHCLEALRRKGASTPTIRLVATFLTNRTMTVRVGSSWSVPLPVTGGCPQGSVLGVDLFNTTTDCLEDDFILHEKQRLGQAAMPIDSPTPTPTWPIENTITTSSPINDDWPERLQDLSPILGGGFRWGDQYITFCPNVANIPTRAPILEQHPPEQVVGTQVLEQKAVVIFKYVDDNMACEKVNFGDIAAVPIGGVPTKTKQAMGCQNAFRSITTNAKKIGMQVNDNKTVLICISYALNYKPSAFILDSNNNRIDSVEEMKVLVFTFSSKPTVAAHVREVVKKLRQRTWSLRHLGKVGFDQDDLVKVYCSTLRPIADYCAPAYHSMLTDQQDQLLEGAQTKALRAIFGYGISARKMRQMADITTLRARRIEATDKFARKCLTNPRFCHWFPKKSGRTSTRSGEEFLETYAKCDRLKNSPVFYMRRRLNGKEGKSYGERNKFYREDIG